MSFLRDNLPGGDAEMGISDAAQDDDGWRARQRIPRDPQAPFGPLVDLELLTDPVHELVERRCEAMHRQYHRRA